jgi:hypothetical protein
VEYGEDELTCNFAMRSGAMISPSSSSSPAANGSCSSAILILCCLVKRRVMSEWSIDDEMRSRKEKKSNDASLLYAPPFGRGDWTGK